MSGAGVSSCHDGFVQGSRTGRTVLIVIEYVCRRTVRHHP